MPPAPEPVAPVEPPPPPAPPAVVGELWVTTDVNVRQGPSADTERVGSLASLVRVGVSGTTEGDWTQVVVDGAAGWVKSSYLSETEPSPESALPAVPGTVGRPLLHQPVHRGQPEQQRPRRLPRGLRRLRRVGVRFGGYRAGDDGDHGSGHAVDIMVSGAAGWEIARFLQANAGELGISYLIYEQQYWPAGSPAGAWDWMADRGSATANHYDHVHVSVR